jgi:hypothetical protein
MNRPALLEADEHAEDSAATPACNFLSGWTGRGLRVGNPRSRAEDHREPKKLMVRYLLTKTASGLTGGTFSYSFARRSNSSSRFT